MLGEEIHEPQVWQLAGRLAYQEGFGSSGFQKRASNWSLQPIINYDTNVNNGFSNDAINIGGLDFLVDEQFRREQAPVVGASLSGSHVWGLSRKLSFNVDHTARYVHAWNGNYDKWSVAVQPCVAYFIASASRAYACGATERAVTELTERKEKSISLGASTAYTIGTYFQSSQITMKRSTISSGVDYVQDSITYQHETLLGDGTLVGVKVKLSEAVDNVFVSREFFHLTAAKIVAGRRLEAGYIQENRRGGMFLNEARKEKLRGIIVSARISNSLSMRVGRFHNEASNSFNNDQFTVFDININLLKLR
ncbi:hypothetical protein ESD82_16385 [Paracoccus pantotrophus]|nr:hypothetical protein [Paracoccus pantotrophus]QFG37685.1 hypothetical protein ESD82_16385 [Paracoccus pantotrophus]